MLSFGVKNFLSFGETGFFVDSLGKLNIFIGKNNSGKSNVLKAVHSLGEIVRSSNNKFGLSESRHWDDRSNIPTLTVPVTLRSLGATTDWKNQWLGWLNEGHLDAEFRLEMDLSTKSLLTPKPDPSNSIVPSLLQSIKQQGDPQQVLNKHLKNPFLSLLKTEFQSAFMVPQYREFRYKEETKKRNQAGSFNDSANAAGYELAERLAWMKSPPVEHNEQREVFLRIQEWVRELLDLPSLEIDFEDPSAGKRPYSVILNVNGLRRYLESYGTGLHQVILMCFAISVRSKSLICIEEPEQFLHPGLQRKFIDFLKQTDNTYFISTHSNVFLDQSFDENACVYHVSLDDRESKVRHIQTTPHAHDVLDELQVHASDIMQANGVIWVEGPTDRMFLLRWLEISNRKLQEGVHFAIMFYGGRLASHVALTTESDWIDNLIPLLRINRNAIIVLDSDKKQIYQRLGAAKKRLVDRLNDEVHHNRGMVWVTKGREIENYVHADVWKSYAEENLEGRVSVVWDRFSSPDEMVKYGKTAQKKFKYSSKKVKHCKALCGKVAENHLDVLDLKAQLKRVSEKIGKWNS